MTQRYSHLSPTALNDMLQLPEHRLVQPESADIVETASVAKRKVSG